MANLIDLPQRLQDKICVDPGSACWWWTHCRNQDGYGSTCWRGRNDVTHRVVYQMLVGPIADGLEIDHLCKNRSCCNPAHLEAVTRRENLLRSGSLEKAREARAAQRASGYVDRPKRFKHRQAV